MAYTYDLLMRLAHLLLCGVAFTAASLNAQLPSPDVLSENTPFQDYAAFSEALNRTALKEVLDNRGSFTIFAPSDTAFSALKEKEQDTDVTVDAHALRSILAYHIVAGEYTASRILKALCRGQGAAVFTTIQGEQLIATLDGIDIVLTDCLGNQARIVRADASAANLVFHGIDSVILPASSAP